MLWEGMHGAALMWQSHLLVHAKQASQARNIKRPAHMQRALGLRKRMMGMMGNRTRASSVGALPNNLAGQNNVAAARAAKQ